LNKLSRVNNLKKSKRFYEKKIKFKQNLYRAVS
jgi:hypothetical protein